MTAGPLDPRFDQDRYRPDEPDAVSGPPGLDPADDPDRFASAGQGQSLPDLLGAAGTFQGERDNYQWVLGLLAVFAFLAGVAFLFNNVLTP